MILLHLVKDVFHNPESIREINDTLIALIPKLDEVKCMKQLRLVGLYNVSCKGITKLVVRIHDIIAYLVGPAQCAFIPRRHGQDNVIVAQELFHSMHLKSCRHGWVAIKMDLEKVYDSSGCSLRKP